MKEEEGRATTVKKNRKHQCSLPSFASESESKIERLVLSLVSLSCSLSFFRAEHTRCLVVQRETKPSPQPRAIANSKQKEKWLSPRETTTLPLLPRPTSTPPSRPSRRGWGYRRRLLLPRRGTSDSATLSLLLTTKNRGRRQSEFRIFFSVVARCSKIGAGFLLARHRFLFELRLR